MARSRNHCCNEKATLLFVCIVEQHVTASNVKILEVAKQLFLAKLRRRKNKSNLGLHVEYPNVCPIFNKFGITCQFKNPQYQISPKSVQLGPPRYLRTDGRTDHLKD
jgi:hypothetical protein